MIRTANSGDACLQDQVLVTGASHHPELPVSIASGFRWTLWLSLLALPFSYLTNVLLARIGPEALGTFGVLNVYIGIVFVFFFWGGCAVPMKFLPELDPEYRSSFLASYGFVILLNFAPWLFLVTWRPQLLHFLFGNAGTPGLQLLLLFLSPLCLCYLLMITSLKAILEMKWAQILDRGITIVLTLVLLVLLFWKPNWLRQHAASAVWLTYIGLTFVVAIVAFYRLRCAGVFKGRPRFWLPPRFWPYTLILQANGFLGVLSSRLDFVLILNTGGLALLGYYVAITSVAAVIPRIAGFAVDSLLPALTNCLSTADMRATVRVADVHLRLIFPVVLSLCLALSLFVRPVLAIMGPSYLQFASLVQVASFGAAIQSFNGYNNTIFTATDRVRHGVIATLVRCIVFATLFWPLWIRFNLSGAVFCWIFGECAYHVTSLYFLHRHAVIKMKMAWTYFGCICTFPIWLMLARQGLQAQYAIGGVLFCLGLATFFLAGRYKAAEIENLVRLMTFSRTTQVLD